MSDEQNDPRPNTAAAEGDRSENAEYIYRKKQLAEIDRRVRYLGKRLDGIHVDDADVSSVSAIQPRLRGRHLGDVRCQQTVEKATGIGAGHLDHAAIGEKCRFHAIPCCQPKRKPLMWAAQGRGLE